MNKINLIVALLGVVFASCKNSSTVTNRPDYLQYLQTHHTHFTSNQEIAFWKNRLARNNDDEASLLKVAGLFAEEFKKSGEISFIQKSDSLYHFLFNRPLIDKVIIYQSLALNAITQHRFQEAQHYIEEALAIGDHEATSLLIQADIAMELGSLEWADKILRGFSNKNSFAWLIRKAKLKDHKGDLDSAIRLMEFAYERIKGNHTLACWTLSNLGDMYGHDGRINKAYESYLKVLALNPTHDHSLKGIAWIALSHDHKAVEAKEIIEFICQRKRMPEAHLMQAEIAALLNDEPERERQLKLFVSMVDNPSYRTMYSRYLALVEVEYFERPEKCISIALEEINNRPAAESYDLLAWGYYLGGDKEEALKIIQDHVLDNTFEPAAIYHMGMIHRANGLTNESNRMLREAMNSSFELGPSITETIEHTLSI